MGLTGIGYKTAEFYQKLKNVNAPVVKKCASEKLFQNDSHR
jgi:hypothetical protein